MAVRIIVGGVELPAHPPRQRGPKFIGKVLILPGNSAPESLKSRPIAEIFRESGGLQLVCGGATNDGCKR